MNDMLRIGVVSDNHGFIMPRVFTVLEGVDEILHAGDIGSPDVITSLEAIAPVRAVYGNIDTFPIVERYPETLAVEIGGIHICVVHEFRGLQDPRVQEALRTLDGKLDVIIYGHTHQASLERDNGIYLFNPGAAGKRRFSLKPAVGRITIQEDGRFTPEIVYLDTE